VNKNQISSCDGVANHLNDLLFITSVYSVKRWNIGETSLRLTWSFHILHHCQCSFAPRLL